MLLKHIQIMLHHSWIRYCMLVELITTLLLFTPYYTTQARVSYFRARIQARTCMHEHTHTHTHIHSKHITHNNTNTKKTKHFSVHQVR